MDKLFHFGLISTNAIFSVLFTFFQTTAVSGVGFTEFTLEPRFDGYRCKPSDTVFEMKSSNILSCGRTCFGNSYCNSVYYQPEIKDCIGCKGFYYNTERLNGSKYGGRYSGPCQPGWINGKIYCYYISSTKTNWTYASKACRSMGGGLLDMQRANEFDDNVKGELVKFWTDIRYDPESQEFFSTEIGTVYNNNREYFASATANSSCFYQDHGDPSKLYTISSSCKDYYHFICKRYN